MKKIQMNTEIKWFIGIWIINILLILLTKGFISIEVVYECSLKQTMFFYVLGILTYVILMDFDMNDFYRDMAICFGCTGVLKYVFLYVMNLVPSTIASLNLLAQIACLSIVYEMSFFALATLSSKKKNITKVIGLNIGALVGILLGCYWIGDKITLVYVQKGTSWLYTEIHMIAMIGFLVILIYRDRIKEKVSDQAFEYLVGLIAIRCIQQLLVTIDSIRHNTLTLGMITICIIISNYYMMKVFFFNVLRKPQQNAYIQLNEENLRLMNEVEAIDSARGELQDLTEQYKNLLKALPDGVMIIENDVIRFANDKMAQLFKLVNPISLESKNIYNLIHPIDYNTFRELVETGGGNALVLIHFSLLEQNFAGETKVIRTNNDNYIVIVKDITERLEVQRMENVLLEKEKEEKIKNQVLANISHEFKTPVNVIYAAAQLQEQNILSKDWAGVRKYSPVVRLNCNRLIRLINNFIDLTRFDYGEFPVKLAHVNIVPIIEDITGSIVSFAENRGISVIFDTQEEELYCQVDVELIDRIMLNLLSNAIKYNKINGNIEVMIFNEGKRVGISVKDTGIGIEQNKIKMLFNRFERLDKTLARDNEGSGLGLNIVKNMIMSLGGEIQVESTFGEGTKMTIYLPLEEHDREGIQLEKEYYYDQARLKKSVEMELSDIYE